MMVYVNLFIKYNFIKKKYTQLVHREGLKITTLIEGTEALETIQVSGGTDEQNTSWWPLDYVGIVVIHHLKKAFFRLTRKKHYVCF